MRNLSRVSEKRANVVRFRGFPFYRGVRTERGGGRPGLLRQLQYFVQQQADASASHRIGRRGGQRF